MCPPLSLHPSRPLSLPSLSLSLFLTPSSECQNSGVLSRGRFIIALETTRLSDNIFETRLSSNIGTSNILHDNQENQETKCLRTSLIRTPLLWALRLRRSWNRCTQESQTQLRKTTKRRRRCILLCLRVLI